MSIKDTARNESLWYGRAWLVGQAGFASGATGEGSITWPSAVTPGMQVTIRDPEKLYNLEDGHIIRQGIDFTCVAQARSHRRIAEKSLEEIADLLSFHTLCPVRLNIEPYSRSPPPAPGATYSAISFGQPGKSSPLNPPIVTPADVFSIYDQPMMSESAKRARVMRSLRWQRRALLAIEPVVIFAHYAFALEAIAPCLEGEKGDDQSKRLRSFATRDAGVPERMWRRVGRLRHSLFHGGIDETSDSVQDAAWCSQVAGYVLAAALKHVLALDASTMPKLPQLQHGQLRDTSMEGGFIRPHPPERLW